MLITLPGALDAWRPALVRVNRRLYQIVFGCLLGLLACRPVPKPAKVRPPVVHVPIRPHSRGTVGPGEVLPTDALTQTLEQGWLCFELPGAQRRNLMAGPGRTLMYLELAQDSTEPTWNCMTLLPDDPSPQLVGVGVGAQARFLGPGRIGWLDDQQQAWVLAPPAAATRVDALPQSIDPTATLPADATAVDWPGGPWARRVDRRDPQAPRWTVLKAEAGAWTERVSLGPAEPVGAVQLPNAIQALLVAHTDGFAPGQGQVDVCLAASAVLPLTLPTRNYPKEITEQYQNFSAVLLAAGLTPTAARWYAEPNHHWLFSCDVMDLPEPPTVPGDVGSLRSLHAALLHACGLPTLSLDLRVLPEDPRRWRAIFDTETGLYDYRMTGRQRQTQWLPEQVGP